MGAFNIVKIPDKCHVCHHIIERRVQFKYGDVWQHEYNLDDTLIWGANNIGSPEFTEVVVDGVGEDCPNCQATGGDYEIWVTQGNIARVRKSTGEFNFAETHRTFIQIITG